MLAGTGKKLLVADDSLTIQKVIRLALSNEGYEIQAVSDGNDAVQQIMLFRPDVVLIDVSLPGQSAFEVKKTVSQSPDLNDVRFVLMSSAFEKFDEAQATQLKFDGRLTKPFDPAHLRQVLSDVLAKEPSISTAAREPEFSDEADFMKPTDPRSLDPFQTEWDKEPSADFDPLPPPDSTDLIGFDFPKKDAADMTMPSMKDFRNAPTEEEFESVGPPPFPGSTPSAVMAASSFEEPESGPDDSDIQELTESTLKMSGLDDLNWTVNETAKKGVTLKPTPTPAPQVPSSLPYETPYEMSNSRMNSLVYQREPELPPTDSMAARESTSFEFEPIGNSSISSSQYGQKENTTQLQPPPQTPGFGGDHDEHVSLPLSTQQMEEMIRKQITETLEKMAQKILPEVAEKIIKQEIHKLLSQTP